MEYMVVRTFTTLRTVWWSADIHEIEDSSVECGRVVNHNIEDCFVDVDI